MQAITNERIALVRADYGLNIRTFDSLEAAAIGAALTLGDPSEGRTTQAEINRLVRIREAINARLTELRRDLLKDRAA